MLDLESISPTILLARGQYASVRSEHENSKKELSVLCGKLSSVAGQILRKMQPDNDEVPDSVEDLLTSGRWVMDEIEKTTASIESLAKQRQDLRPLAWGRKIN